MRTGFPLVRTILGGMMSVLLLTGPAAALDVGQKAPDFTLPGSKGQPVKLSELTAKGPVVIYTFMQAFAALCTAEISRFEANLPQFETAGVQVVGVSVDHPNALGTFTKNNGIKHLLLSDFGRKMLPAYSALVTDKGSGYYWHGKRAYFIVDRDGIVRWVRIQADPLDIIKPDAVLKALKEFAR